MRLSIAFLAAFFAAACNVSDMSAPAISSVCERIGEQCQRADGPLGVCLEMPCKAGETPPCFACTSQH